MATPHWLAAIEGFETVDLLLSIVRRMFAFDSLHYCLTAMSTCSPVSVAGLLPS